MNNSSGHMCIIHGKLLANVVSRAVLLTEQDAGYYVWLQLFSM